MSRPPYPHRCIGAPSDGTDFFDWTCQCGALPDIYGTAAARDGWGSGCRVAMEERIADLEIRLDAAIERANVAEARCDAMEGRMVTADAPWRVPGCRCPVDPVQRKAPVVEGAQGDGGGAMTHHRSGLTLGQRAHLHDLVHTDSIERGIRCDTEWCNAFHDHRLMCGDRQGSYTGMVHRNRAERAEARDAHQPYEHGRVFPDPEFD